MFGLGNALARLRRRVSTTAEDAARVNPSVGKALAQAPRIVPRSEHTISRRNISPGALRVLYRLHEAGFAAFLVGGAVRDLLLGGSPKDFDVATDATPEQVRQLFRNCRLIGRRFRLAHVVFGREIVEVATFRGHGEDGEREVHDDGRILRDNVWGSIEEDALRRDFRVNALYYDIADFSVRDYVGGMDDLARRQLQLIGDAEQRYREDPVRMLRAARLSAKLDFAIAPASAAPMRALVPLLADVSPARLFDECIKLFMAGHGQASFAALERHGLLDALIPGLPAALARDADGGLRRMLEAGLAGTDARVHADKPVTPAFSFAVLLWSAVQQTLAHHAAEDAETHAAWLHAAQQAIARQSARVAIPRRYSVVMEEIWALQPRFEVRSPRSRVQRLLAHPRFRAGYDFLLLRALQQPSLQALAQWWTEAQQSGSLPTVPAALPDEVGEEGSVPAPARATRRRRRGGRGRRRAGTSGDGSA